MMNITIIFINTIILFLCIVILGEGIVSYTIVLLFVILLLKKYFKRYFQIGLFCYSFFSLVGLLFAIIYNFTYGNTFSPYFDDSFYYYNSLYLSHLSFANVSSPTLFEIIISVPLFLFSLLGIQLSHIDLLPIIWAISSLNILLAIKIAQNYFNIKKVSTIAVFSLLLNFSFLDTSVHLYRDAFIIFFSLLSILFLLKNKYKIAILFAIFVFFIRGANGVLMFYFITSIFLIRTFNIKLKTIIISTFASIVFLTVIGGNNISGTFIRGGFGYWLTEESKSLGMVDRIKERTESISTSTSMTGTVSLINGNLFQKISVPVIYTFSPFILPPSLYRNSIVLQATYYNFGGNLGTFNIFQIEFFLFLFHIVILSYLFPRIAYSFYMGITKSVSPEMKFIFLFIILVIYLISFISMQARHRLFFLMFFPFLLYNYRKYASSKGEKVFVFMSINIFLVLIIANLLYFLWLK